LLLLSLARNEGLMASASDFVSSYRFLEMRVFSNHPKSPNRKIAQTSSDEFLQEPLSDDNFTESKIEFLKN
jgi:hypothetical protein